MKLTIQEAKERIRIPDLWPILNLPGRQPARVQVILSPFREEIRESFSIFNDGRMFKDHATGESGDVITFYGMARGIENRQATKDFLTLASEWQ